MNNLIKKSFLISMVVMTAMWGLLGAVNVQANVAAAGDLVKSASSPAVYYLDSSNVKHPFHHEREYMTWYSDFSAIKTIPTDEMVSYTLGSTVVVRPGTRLVQYVEVLGDGTWNVSNTPEVYAASSSGTLQKVTDPATAVALYGSAWEKTIVPLPNYLSANYKTGTALTSSSTYPTGTLVKLASAAQVYYIDGTTKRPVTDAGMTANRFNMNYVVTASSLTAYTDGTSLTAKEDAIANPIAGAATTVTGTGLTVALAPDSPGAQVAPGAATNVPLLKFNLTASADGAVTVSQVNIKRAGVGDTNDFINLYLYDGATRLTNGKTLNSTTHIAQFTSLGLNIAAGTTKTVTLAGDVGTLGTAASAANSGNVHYFMVESGAITSSATVNGAFPVMGNVTSIGSSSSGDVTIAKNGSLSNPVIGQNDASLAQFQLTAGTGEDLEIRRITLYQSGSINNSYITDLKLWQGTTQLSSVSSITSKSLIVFDLSSSPYSLLKNTNKIFKVTGDISGSARNSDTTKIYLENDVDMYALGKSYGFGADVTATAFDGNDTSCTSQSTCEDSTYLVVQGGQVTLAMNGPQSGSLAKGTTNAVFMNFSITAGVNSELRKIRVELHEDDGAGSDLDKDSAPCSTDLIYNVKVVDTNNGESTGAVDCSSFTDLDSSDGVYYDFADYFSFTAGQTRNFAVKADLHTTLTANDYYVVLGRSGTTYAASVTDIYTISTTDGFKNLDNNQWITDIVPTTSTTGNEMTVAAAALGWALSSNATAVTVIQGTNNVNLGEFAFNASQGSPVTMSSLTLTGYIASTSPTGANSVATDNYKVDMGAAVYSYVNNIISNLRLYDVTADPNMTTNLNSTAEGLSSAAGTATFSNMSWVIPAGTTHVLRAVGDISNTAYANGVAGNKHVKVNIAAVADVSLQDSDGNSVTLTDDDLTTAWAIAQGNGAATDMASSYYITAAQAGTLNVTAESNPATANVVAGTNNVPMLRLKFQSTNEAFNVNKLRIYQSSNTTFNRAVTGITISYQNQAGTTVTLPQATVAGVADFNITSNPLYVPSGGSRIVTASFNIPAINQTYAAYTGDRLEATFDYDSNFEAKGAGNSSTNLTDTSNDVNVASNVMTVHGTLPTITADASSQSLTSGPVDLYKWQLTAAEGTDLTLKKVSFKLSMTDSVLASATLTLQNFTMLEGDSYAAAAAMTQGDSGVNSYQVYNGWGPTGTANSTGFNGGKLSAADGYTFWNQTIGSTTGSSSHNVIVVFNDDRLVTQGASKYYILRATANGVDSGASSNDAVGMYMYDGDTATTSYNYVVACNGIRNIGLASRYCLGDMYNANDTMAYMIWSDSTGSDGNNTHTDITGFASTSADWFNGYNVKTLSGQRNYY
ncbi:MAG: hypothetical protein A2927_00730 [Candidatus Komeilibacteria bacterium RIFCSPLOWO2_01_FULL_45_10]|uniref:Uncharacterized protein n=1 Tax=Candidatus Komeilibacteria bacterium RIFCSPLOWO2_01_FULL_45_10 TaxID=1798550 RepID=A0A1G2BLW9_9BACT|nr:MAG: hypothetical protein A2927_00730 [Candidatus Komeilibacteria bacterium RIFCSPLOWO2_01_FULL_45_10]